MCQFGRKALQLLRSLMCIQVLSCVVVGQFTLLPDADIHPTSPSDADYALCFSVCFINVQVKLIISFKS